MTLKGLFLCLVFLLCNATSHAADDLITRQVTIKLDKAGTLPDKIGSSRKYKITNLKIVGEINGTDWRLIRDMAGRDFDRTETSGELSVLDLSEAKIVSGGSRYDAHTFRSTPNNCIGENAFVFCSGLTSITLPSGVTSIGGAAFMDCSGLTSLTIPSGVTSIGGLAFSGCSGLTNLTLPSGVTSIGGAVFEDCRGLTSLTIPPGVTEIGASTFRHCSGLTSLSLPSSLTSIGESAFEGCSGLTSLTIPSGVTSINESAFEDCSGLTSLALPSSVTLIDDYAFRGCCGLTSLALPSSVTLIDAFAFEGCSGLTSLTLPSSITSINLGVFRGCSGLTSLTIPSSVTLIDDYAFAYCSGLTSIYVYPEKVPILRKDTFSGCDAKNCTVYVPTGTYDDYWLSDFGYFENIVEFDATGIDKVTTSNDAKELSRYSVNGQRLSAPTKGLNIVKYSDGSVKKVAVQ